jgi:hypothetical protein
VPIRWLIPMKLETAPRGFPWGGCRSLAQLPLRGSRPGAQGSLKLRGRVRVPVSLRGCPERHISIVRHTERSGNEISGASLAVPAGIRWRVT